jgi:hypothetical protein
VQPDRPKIQRPHRFGHPASALRIAQ